MAGIQKLKNSARGLKSWYTRVETSCEPYAMGTKTGTKDMYAAKRKELTQAKENIDRAMTELLLVSDFADGSSEETNHLKTVADLQTAYDDMMDSLAQKEMESQRAEKVKAENTKRFVKPIFELRPKQLNSNSSINEVEPFCKQFQAFYNQSNLDLCSNDDAQQYLKNCLDLVLVQHLDTKIDSTTPILGGSNSCLNYIREYFTQKHPLLTLRMDAFSLKQPNGVPFLDFYGKANQVYRSAEISKLTSEQLTSYLLITATTDEELKKEFLKLKAPDIKALLDCAQQHVRANQTSNRVEKTETFAITQFDRSRPKNRSLRSHLRRLGITCGRCGSRDGHSYKDCNKERDQLECSTCKDEGRPCTGHVAATCFDNLGIPRSRNNSGSQSLSQERNRSGSGSRLQRRASTPWGYRENGVYQVEDGDLSDNFDFSDGVFQINEDFTAGSNSTDEITSININDQIDKEPKEVPLPQDFDSVNPIELMDIPLLSMEVELSTKRDNKIKVLANPETGTANSLLLPDVASAKGNDNATDSIPRPVIKATTTSIRTTTPSAPASSDQHSWATKPANATAPANVKPVVNQANNSEEEDVLARARYANIGNPTSTATTPAAGSSNDVTMLEMASSRPHYDLKEFLENSTSATGTIDDYEQGYNDGYDDGRDDAYNDFSNYENDYYD